MTNRERLEAAGILTAETSLDSEQIEAIESLTSQEVDTLISIYEKLRTAPFSPSLNLGPQIPRS